MATLIIPTPLRKYTDGAARFSTDGITVEDAIEELITSHPALRQHLLDSQDQVRSFIKVFVGEDDIKALDGLSTEIDSADVVSIVPAIAGGAS